MARGRKSLFREEYIQLAENYALLGATDDELADFFGVSKQTLNKWKKDYPEFLDSLKEERILQTLMLLRNCTTAQSVTTSRKHILSARMAWL